MITFKTEGNTHYIHYDRFTVVFDRLSDAWDFIFKLREELKSNER